jgi:phosphatidylserine synthase
MWKPSKKVLFAIVLLMAICSGLSLGDVNWELVQKGENVFKELLLPCLFIALSFYFLVPYVKKLKGER